MSILIGGTILAVLGVAAYEYNRLRREREEAVLVLQAVQQKIAEETNQIAAQYKSSYSDEPCDTEMQQACLVVLRRNFPNGIEQTFAMMASLEDRREFVRGVAKELAEALNVGLHEVDFSKGKVYEVGRYLYADPQTDQLVKSIWLNDIYLVTEPELVIKALLHELRHAVQAETICEGNRWGVSLQRRKEWMYSNTSYVDCTAVYCLQPIEVDANVFSERIMNLFNGVKKK